MHSIAVLIGNGLSIAYNGNLTIPKITEAIVHRFNEPVPAVASRRS